MTAFKKTILGKILGGVAKVAPFAAAAASFLIPAVGPAIGTSVLGKLVSNIGKTVKNSLGAQVVGGVVNAIGTVGKEAVNLVTGTTVAERQQVSEVKAVAKAAQDKIEQVDRLVEAGASTAQAQQMVGITPTELGSPNSTEADADAIIKAQTQKIVTSPGPTQAGCMVTTLLLLAGLIGTGFLAFIIL